MNRLIKSGLKTIAPILLVSLILFCYICIAGCFDVLIDSSHSFISWLYLAIGITIGILFIALITFLVHVISEYKILTKSDNDGS